MISATDQLTTEQRQILIAVNPRAGSGKRQARVDELAERLRAGNFPSETLTDLTEVGQRASQLQAQGQLRAVVGAGGDGTLHELLNCTPPGVPLAMLPLGTENLLAKYLQQGMGADNLAEMIEGGRIANLDAGRANQRLFLLMASAGFDADVTRRLHESRTGHIRHTSYLRPIVSAIRKYNYPPMQIEVDSADGVRRIEARWCFVFNLPSYGFGLKFVADADGSDGLLDMCTFERGGLWNALRYTSNLYLRRHHRLPDCERLQAARVRITSDEFVPYQLDGDPIAQLPLELGVVPSRLTLLVPGAAKRS